MLAACSRPSPLNVLASGFEGGPYNQLCIQPLLAAASAAICRAATGSATAFVLPRRTPCRQLVASFGAHFEALLQLEPAQRQGAAGEEWSKALLVAAIHAPPCTLTPALLRRLPTVARALIAASRHPASAAAAFVFEAARVARPAVPPAAEAVARGCVEQQEAAAAAGEPDGASQEGLDDPDKVEAYHAFLSAWRAASCQPLAALVSSGLLGELLAGRHGVQGTPRDQVRSGGGGVGVVAGRSGGARRACAALRDVRVQWYPQVPLSKRPLLLARAPSHAFMACRPSAAAF